MLSDSAQGFCQEEIYIYKRQQQMISGGADKRLVITDAASGRQSSVNMSLADSSIIDLVVSQDATKVIGCGTPNIHLWEVQTGR